jgi:hypothetical protein
MSSIAEKVRPGEQRDTDLGLVFEFPGAGPRPGPRPNIDAQACDGAAFFVV